MKNIKLIFASLVAAAMVLSCNDDGGDSVRAVQYGAVPNIKKVAGTEAIINLNEVQQGNDFALSFTVDKGFGDPASMDIVAFYIKTDGTAEKAILAANVTTFPTTINITKATLINAYESLAGDADFELGDQLKISADVTLKDGTVIKLLKDGTGAQNYGQDIANSTVFSVIQVYTVACPSDLGGEYQFTTTNVGEPGGGTVAGPLTGTVTFTDTGGGVYDISDASFGGWLGLYGPSADSMSIGVTLIDICGTLSFGGEDQFKEIFTITEVTVNGSELSFHWENDYGEFGDTVLTRTDGTDWPPLVSGE